MTQEEYVKLAIDCQTKHSCLLFQDESIETAQIGLFVPSRAFALPALKVYLASFGVAEEAVLVIALPKRPKNAPLGGYVVTIPLPAP